MEAFANQESHKPVPLKLTRTMVIMRMIVWWVFFISALAQGIYAIVALLQLLSR
jgi:hypothetical protein